MDRERFDAFTRLVSAGGSRRHALAILAGGLLHHDAASLLAGPRKRTSKGKGKRQRQRRPDEAVVCHNGKQFLVPRDAVRGILLDGGTLGPCSVDAPLGSEVPCKTTDDCRRTCCNSVCDRSCSRCDFGFCKFTCFGNGEPCGDEGQICLFIEDEARCITPECTAGSDCPTRPCLEATCQNRLCVYLPAANGRNGPGCSGANQCWDGQCLSPPTCLGVNQPTDSQCSGCCSTRCNRLNSNPPQFFCAVGRRKGVPCHDNNDCLVPAGPCVAFHCA